MSRAFDMIGAALGRLRGATDEDWGREAARLLDRHGGDVAAATRWLNQQMRAADVGGAADRSRQALRLRRALGRVWAQRIGAATARAAVPR